MTRAVPVGVHLGGFRPSGDLLFRIGGLVACAIVALPHVTRLLAGDVATVLRDGGVQDLSRINLAGARIALAAIPIVIATLFATAFWLNTRPQTFDRPRRRAIGLLVVQTLIALTLSDYFFLVAAQAPFVFSPRAAFAWLAAQLVLFVAFVVVFVSVGAQAAIPEMAGTPLSLAIPVTVVYLSGWQIFAFGVGYLAANERRAHRELSQRTRELIATQQMLADSSRLAERAQISRELHDTLGHSLAVLNVNLELASHLTHGRAADAVTKAQTVARMMLADVREVVHAFGDERLVDLRGALTTLVADARAPIVHLSLPEDLVVADAAKAHVIFRCVQEAMTNAVRHARARSLWITLTQSHDGIDVHIADDGRGCASGMTTDGRGHGLTGMRARLEAVGGSLTIEASPGHGFTIDARIPIAKEQP